MNICEKQSQFIVLCQKKILTKYHNSEALQQKLILTHFPDNIDKTAKIMEFLQFLANVNIFLVHDEHRLNYLAHVTFLMRFKIK